MCGCLKAKILLLTYKTRHGGIRVVAHNLTWKQHHIFLKSPSSYTVIWLSEYRKLRTSNRRDHWAIQDLTIIL